MDKFEQYAINREVVHVYDKALWELTSGYFTVKSKKLRSCNAVVHETPDYYVLQSYNTLIAVIVKENYLLIDMLRYVYGYTATSAKHIVKFRHDYTPYPWNYQVLTWRKVK